MRRDYDVVVVGGAFSGAATALLLLRERPGLRVAIIERTEAFDRKVGEATTEVSGHFLAHRLHQTQHLLHHHIPKQGLRFWFARGGGDAFEDCGELGAKFQVRLPSYQVDREVLDQHLLDEAVAAGAVLYRPAKVVSCEPGEGVEIQFGPDQLHLGARQIIDASGRAALMARKRGTLRPLPEHPTNSVWARFRGVADLDGHGLRSRDADYRRACITSRAAATNHLAGYGWWCWIIPLKGGDTSVGIVYDTRLFSLPGDGRLATRLHDHLLGHPVGRTLFADATPVEGDAKAYSALPYFSEEICGSGWHAVGDAAGFLDPLYSAGLDYCSWTSLSAVRFTLSSLDGAAPDPTAINRRFLASYRGWFEALYKDKYHYLGDFDLMEAAFLMDLGLFFFGPVRELHASDGSSDGRFPFDGPVDGVVARLMAFANRRLAILGRRRQEAGVFGKNNLHRRVLVPGFEPTPRVLRLVWRGVTRWIEAECRDRLRPAARHPGVRTCPAEEAFDAG